MKSDLQIAAEAAEKERQGIHIREMVWPEQSLQAEALADGMNWHRRQAYIYMLAAGLRPADAAEYVWSVPVDCLMGAVRRNCAR